MIELESVKRMESLKQLIETVTGETYEDLTVAVKVMKDIVARYKWLADNARAVDFNGSGITELYLDCKNLTKLTNLIAGCPVTEVHLINTHNVYNWSYSFTSNNSTLKTLDTLDFSGTTEQLGYNYIRLGALENLKIVSETIKSSATFPSYSPNLTAESIQSIIDGLAYVTTANTVTFHQKSILTDEQKATISNKGWTLVQG